MNSLERILRATRLEPVDRTPLVPQLFGHAAITAGLSLRHYLHDGEALAHAQVLERERYRTDAVFAFLDFGVEAEALGAPLSFRAHRYPDVVGCVLRAEDDPSRLRLPDPAAAGRMPVCLQALRAMRRRLGDDALVAGAVAGPMTTSAQLYGIENALYLAIDDPPRLAAALDFATRLAIAYGLAQLDAGAHAVIVFEPAASPAVVPPAFFREFVAPRLARVLGGLRDGGAAFTWLNIAGPTAGILDAYARIGADVATFDYYLSAAEACHLLPQTCLAGNLRSLDFLDAAPGVVEHQARELVVAFEGRSGFLLSSGCEIPPEAAAESIAAMAAALSVE